MQLTRKLSLALGALFLAASAGSALADITPDPNSHKTTICHSTGSTSNPFVVITVDNNSLDKHADHHEDVNAVDGECPGDIPPDPENPDPTVLVCFGSQEVNVRESNLQQFLDDNPEAEVSSDGTCPPPPAPQQGCSNTNSGFSVLQSCDLAVLANVLSLGQSSQTGVIGGSSGSGGSSNTNSGFSVAQLANTILGVNGVNLGQSTQSAQIP